MEYQNTYQYMKYKIEQSIPSHFIKNLNDKPEITSIDDFNSEQKKEILLCFFREITEESKEKIQDKLLDEPTNLMLRILNIADHQKSEKNIVNFLWIYSLSKLEDIYDEAEKDSLKKEMSENDEHLLFDTKDRISDIKEQVKSQWLPEIDYQPTYTKKDIYSAKFNN